MRKITLEDYKLFEPNNNRIKFEQLDEKRQNDYMIMQSAYYHYLLEYLCKKTDIEKSDNILKNSELNFVNIDEENMDLYQYLSSTKLSYFYIRNNIYIENLSVEEQRILIKYVKCSEYNDEIEKLIENTLNKVIIENGSQKEVNIPFGPITTKFMCKNGSLVIGVRYDEFNLNGKTDDEWDMNHDKQEQLLFQETLNLEYEISQKLNIPVKIIKYDDFSIKKKIESDDLKR